MSDEQNQEVAPASPKRGAKLSVESLESGDGFLLTFVATGTQLEVHAGELTEEIQEQLLLHGLKQKLQDAAAGCEAEHVEAAVSAVWDALKEGRWTQRTGGGGAPKISQLAEALAKVTGQEVNTCVEVIAKMDDEQKKNLRGHPQIKAAITEIKVQKLQEEQEKARKDAANAPKLDLGSLAA